MRAGILPNTNSQRIFLCHTTNDDDNNTQGAHLEQSTPYHVLSELTVALMAIIVEPDRKGRIVMEEFSEAMPTEVRGGILTHV